MPRKLTLYGRPIFLSHAARTLADQVYDILLQEIYSGHWRVGERLPSVSMLAEESGISRSPIQSALDRLRAQGYVRIEHRSGAFLASISPKGRPPLGTIGVAMVLLEEAEQWATVPHTHDRLVGIQAAAEKRNYLVDAKYLTPNDDWDSIDSPQGPFGDRVMGVISLYPFARMGAGDLRPGQTPLVFMDVYSHNSLPLVTGDSRNAMYALTAAAIAKEHREILYCSNPYVPDRERETRFAGHVMAMREAGLSVNENAEAQSLSLPTGDLSALKAFLLTYPHATAVICRSMKQAKDVTAVTDALGIRVPEDLSVVSAGPGSGGSSYMRGDDRSRRLTYADFPGQLIVDKCIDLLEEQMKTRRRQFDRIEIAPVVCMHDSLAEPRANGFAPGARAADARGDLSGPAPEGGAGALVSSVTETREVGA